MVAESEIKEFVMQKTVAFSTLGLAAVILASTAYMGNTAENNEAITADAGNGVVVISGLRDGTYLFKVSGSQVTLTPATVINIDGPIVPDPIPTPNPQPNPSDSLSQIVKKNIPADYANLNQDRRAIAFTIEFLKDAVAANPDVAKSRQVVQEACNKVVEPNQAKWNYFWIPVLNKLNTMQLTPQSYKAALTEISAALTEDLPQAAVTDSDGQKTFGLSPDFISFLMKVLLPLLLELLKGLQ